LRLLVGIFGAGIHEGTFSQCGGSELQKAMRSEFQRGSCRRQCAWNKSAVTSFCESPRLTDECDPTTVCHTNHGATLERYKCELRKPFFAFQFLG